MATRNPTITAEDFADAVMSREHRRMTTPGAKWERMRTEDIRAESFADVSITTVRKAANAARDKGLIEDTSHHDGRREWRVSRSYLHARIAEWIDDARAHTVLQGDVQAMSVRLHAAEQRVRQLEAMQATANARPAHTVR